MQEVNMVLKRLRVQKLKSKWMPFLHLLFKVISNVKNFFNNPCTVLDIFKCQATETHKIHFK